MSYNGENGWVLGPQCREDLEDPVTKCDVCGCDLWQGDEAYLDESTSEYVCKECVDGMTFAEFIKYANLENEKIMDYMDGDGLIDTAFRACTVDVEYEKKCGY